MSKKILGKYQGRERRTQGGFIECLIKRDGPTPITMDGFQYVFTPNLDGRCITFIQNPSHCERLLADEEAYREIFPDQEKKAAAVEAKKKGDLPVSGAKDSGGDVAPGLVVTDEQRALVVKLYFDDKINVKEMVEKAEGIAGVLDRKTVGAIILDEKGKRGIM